MTNPADRLGNPAHQAELTFDCGSAGTAALLLRTLGAEATEGPEGSSVRLSAEGQTVHAAIAGTDVATLRAAINSVARLADTALRTLAVSKKR
jgi:tRNA threonylcarbamoyladenosine modification (KEOPS) complex  Pcc1 subunit